MFSRAFPLRTKVVSPASFNTEFEIAFYHGGDLRGAGCARADPAFLLRAGSLERQPVERWQDNGGAGVVGLTGEKEKPRG